MSPIRESEAAVFEIWSALRHAMHRLTASEDNVNRLLIVEKLCIATQAYASNIRGRAWGVEYVNQAQVYIADLLRELQFQLSQRGHIVGVWDAGLLSETELSEAWAEKAKSSMKRTEQNETDETVESQSDESPEQ